MTDKTRLEEIAAGSAIWRGSPIGALRGGTPNIAVLSQQIDHQVCGHAQAHSYQ
jgi:hypothetical protein